MARLERLLGVPRERLREVARVAGKHYSPFPKPTRIRPFARKVAPSKVRMIDNPTAELKTIQSLIARRLLQTIILPDNICGGVRGKSVRDNVVLHRNSRVLLKVDIARFFPSITNLHVYSVWHELLGCSHRVSALLTKLTTYERHLPQGAPTSTQIANLVLYACDGDIRELCQRLQIQYSTWVDDLAFSSDNPRPIIVPLIESLRSHGFRISRRKMEIVGPGKQKILNGVLLGRHLAVPSGRRSRIRAGIHRLRMGHVHSSNEEQYIASLKGSIAQIKSIDPNLAVGLERDLQSACEACASRKMLASPSRADLAGPKS